MKKFLSYFASLMVHKWYVFLAGLRTGAPVWRLIIHDWSKFSPTEMFGYAGNIGGAVSKKKWSKSWLHHLHCNAHHPEHWVLSWRGDPDFYWNIGKDIAWCVVVLPMPEVFVREMLADMMGVSRKVTGSWGISVWLNENGPKMHMHDKTIILVNKIMEELGYELTDDTIDWSWVLRKGERT